LPDNPTGFFEHTDVVGVHEELLAVLGTAWDDPRSLPPNWHRQPAIAPFRDKLVAIIARDFAASRLWGVKDPRLCRTLPLWLDVLAKLNVDAKAILVARDPAAVAASLRKRNFIDAEQSTLLWLSYMLSAEEHTRGLARTVVLYDDLLANWEAEIQRLRDTLDLDIAAISDEVRGEVAAYLDAELRHHRNPVAPVLRAPQNAYAMPVFEALVAWRRDAVPSLDVCTFAATELASAERAAEPIARYVGFKARTDFDASLKAELDAAVEARRQLQLALISETQARADDRRDAAEAAAREADARAQLDLRARAQAKSETQLAAEIAAARASQHRAEVAAESEAQLRAQVLADRQSEAQLYQTRIAGLERLLRDIQSSHSWRLTRPIRVGLTVLRNGLQRRKRRTASQPASPPN
jgi:hypothetical protein